jgi:hypothetical protein
MPMSVKITYDMYGEDIAELKISDKQKTETLATLKQYFDMLGKNAQDQWDIIWETMYKSEQDTNQYLKALDNEVQYLKRKIKSENIASLMIPN